MLAAVFQEFDTNALPSNRSIRRAVFELKKPTSIVDNKSPADDDYQLLPAATDEFMKQNPGSIAICDLNTDQVTVMFDRMDPDGTGSITQEDLSCVMKQYGYSENDLKKVHSLMKLDSNEDKQAVSKDLVIKHFGNKFRRFAIVFKDEVWRCVR